MDRIMAPHESLRLASREQRLDTFSHFTCVELSGGCHGAPNVAAAGTVIGHICILDQTRLFSRGSSLAAIRLHRWEAHPGSTVNDLAYVGSRERPQRLLSVGDDGRICTWQSAPGAESSGGGEENSGVGGNRALTVSREALASVSLPGNTETAVLCVAAAGAHAVAGYEHGIVARLQADEGGAYSVLASAHVAHRGAVSAAAACPSAGEHCFATVGEDSHLCIWDVRTHKGIVWNGLAQESSNGYASAGGGGKSSAGKGGGPLTCCEFDTQGRWVVLGGQDGRQEGRVVYYSLLAGRVTSSVQLPDAPTALAAGTNALFAGCDTGRVYCDTFFMKDPAVTSSVVEMPGRASVSGLAVQKGTGGSAGMVVAVGIPAMVAAVNTFSFEVAGFAARSPLQH